MQYGHRCLSFLKKMGEEVTPRGSFLDCLCYQMKGLYFAKIYRVQARIYVPQLH